MTEPRRAADAATLRRWVPPPIETLFAAVPGRTAEAECPGEARGDHDAGYRAGFAAGLERGRAEGNLAGFADGIRQAGEAAAAEMERSRREGIAALKAGLSALLARRAEDRAALERDARAALAAVVALLAPALARQGLAGELEALVAEAMGRRGEATVTLRAHPETLAALPSGAAGPGLDLMPDPAMRKDTAEASWAGGGHGFDAAALAARALAILTPPGPAPADAAFDDPG